MNLSRNAAAWELVCQRWQSGHHWFDDAIPPVQRTAHEHLVELKAVKPVAVNQQFALCGHCGLHTAPIFRDKAALRMQCPECGPVAVAARDLKAWVVDEEWLIRKLRAAFSVPTHQEVVRITAGVWRIGLHQRTAVLLARRLDLLLQQPSVLARGRGETVLWLITPKRLREGDDDPVAGAARWLPMEERFTLYGGNVSFIDADTSRGDEAIASADPVYGPFSADFRWVRLQGEGASIELSEAQAAVLKALWEFGGQSQEAHLVMSRAGLASDKPIDVFKVKAQHKGNERYEGPLRAYKALVKTNQRAGTYALAPGVMGAAISSAVATLS
ncbi:hypothetical protein JI739_19330 [Ramlibacter sp. AW1]|uniref:Uncharacterized protein n=1 Tax=Ramlibacter aurantiacus TaxID=2801330 RepID=A0A936ZMI4_9BURK|nr:hypothetical protein [Ramlibacter aurantiacus]MBL0422507.1 hypothetical protein [Ramlibacter aurantiacus]